MTLQGAARIVYLMGNPIVLWLVLAAVIAFIVLKLTVWHQLPRKSKKTAMPKTEDIMLHIGSWSFAYAPLKRPLTVGMYCFICYWLNLLPVRQLPRMSLHDVHVHCMHG